MKKIVAILMALCLLLASSAMATEINWSDVEPTITELGAEGDFSEISTIGVKMFIPAGLEEVELSEEDVKNGYICYLANADQSFQVAVMYADLGGASLEDYAATLPDVGATDVELATLNGIPAVSYSMPENDTNNVAFLTDTGYAIEFVFHPASDEDLAAVAGVMAASIQPV